MTSPLRPRFSPVGRSSSLGNERGSVLLVVMLCLVVVLGMGALAVDLGIAHVARSEAQRAADAGAHAGAGIFLQAPGDAAGARAEARGFTEANAVRRVELDVRPDEDIDVLVDSQKVRVRVYRSEDRGNPLATLFARVLGIRTVDIGASAAAQSWPASGVPCVLPFAVPDRWSKGPYPHYANHPGFSDRFGDDPDDFYVPMSPNDPTAPHTGYSRHDRGYQIQIYASAPNEAPHPSWWYPFRLPGGQGADLLRSAIVGCVDEGLYRFGDAVLTEPGGNTGPIRQGFQDLLGMDPSAAWNPQANGGQGCVTTQGTDACRSSPRIRPLVLFDPREYPDQGAKPFTVTNFVGVFVEGITGGGNNLRVTVRFIEYTGVEPAAQWHDGEGGSLLRTLRIVE